MALKTLLDNDATSGATSLDLGNSSFTSFKSLNDSWRSAWSGLTGTETEEIIYSDNELACLRNKYERLRFTRQDLSILVDDDESFQRIKRILRKRGCVTDTYLAQKMHLFVRRAKNRQKEAAETGAHSSASSSESSRQV